MYKFFALALAVIHLFSHFLYALDNAQIVNHEKISETTLTLQKFKSCDAMESKLTEYFKKSLSTQVPIQSRQAPIEENISDGAALKGAKSETIGNIMSQTNVQTHGIDEADVIKTDGKYIYFASNLVDADGYQYVTVARAIPAEKLEVIKRIKLPGNYSSIQLYLADNRLTILAQRWENTHEAIPISVGNGTTTVVSIYDVSNIENLTLTRFYTISGDLSQSRRDGDYLYVFSQNSLSYNPWAYAKNDFKDYLDKTFNSQDVLPKSLDVRYNPSSLGKKIPYIISRKTVGCEEVEYLFPENANNLSYTTLSIVPLKGNGDITRKVIYGDIAQFFMSETSFYIVGNHWKQGGNFICPITARCTMPMFQSEQNSLIHRFSTQKGHVKYEYSTLVPGIPLSQYALHERDGVLFIANQKDWSVNGVDIFSLDSKGKLLSRLENVGAKERFQSARYIGDRLYLVTFLQVDPLFVINTKDPKKMKIEGELVMPGYSTYLHPYDSNHIIGIGYDTNTNQWGGTTNGGLKIDLYDVSDVFQPKQKFSQVFGGVGSSSESLTNPQSLIWDSVRKTLLIPAQLMDQNLTTYQYTAAWQGLLAVKIDAKDGIKTEAKISHIDMTSISQKRKDVCAQYVSTPKENICYTHLTTGEKICPNTDIYSQTVPAYCYAENDDLSYLAANIWEYSGNFVQRGLYIGNVLFTVSPEIIQANMYGSAYSTIKTIKNK